MNTSKQSPAAPQHSQAAPPAPPPLRHAYRLRHRHSGLFSTGGTRPRWATEGKLFVSARAMKNHLHWFFGDMNGWGFDGERMPAPYIAKQRRPDDYEVVRYTLTAAKAFSAAHWPKGDNR